MDKVGPHLDELTHWLTECPAEFYQLPIDSDLSGRAARHEADEIPINVAAIASDHLRDLEMPLSEIQRAGAIISRMAEPEQRLVAIAVWLLREPWLIKQTQLVVPIGKLLTKGLAELARTIKPESVVTDADRREELVRLCLAELGYRPAGETVEQARDRLTTLDSVERVRIVSQTRDAESRARAIRQAMAQKRAQEAAARYSPE
ncbi:MAG: hypothetical protein ABI614_16665 [Planctomycetota bacterium]